ncbi:MAG: Phosphoribosylaminoimidazole-succinocarboxamide synthase [Elusimicrobia bacterium]|nr:Phosphoribosylaminoimidazole-succinocarboxamide synthase [Elusimicrobiota bacterium]
MNKEINLPLFRRGKVRDVYDLGSQLLLVASDRISAFDYVLPTLVPDKGKILNEISVFWFKKLEGVIANHLITADVRQYPAPVQTFKTQIEQRSMLVQKTDKIEVECIVRGYLAGSGWKDYQKTGQICGITLPGGLVESEKLPEPIFTPTTKAEGGAHDENMTFEEMTTQIGKPLAHTLKNKSLELYEAGRAWAESRGIILADTKFEFGMVGGQPILIDEVMTPDSSRFWDMKTYAKGRSQDSFDKQFVRDYLEGIHWNKQPPVPSLPPEIVEKTRQKYLDAFERITGQAFEIH